MPFKFEVEESCGMNGKSNKVKRMVLKVPYCGILMEWVIVFNFALDLGPDLIPKRLECADDFYDIFDIQNIEELTKWNLDKVDSLFNVAKGIRDAFKAYQAKKIQELGADLLSLDKIIDQHKSADILLNQSKGTIQIFVPLWEDEEIAISKGALPSVLSADEGFTLKAEFSLEQILAGNMKPDAYDVSIPAEFQITSKAYNNAPAVWLADMTVPDYLSFAKERVLLTWRQRRELICKFAQCYACLEFDAIDYSCCSLLVRVGPECHSDESSLNREKNQSKTAENNNKGIWPFMMKRPSTPAPESQSQHKRLNTEFAPQMSFVRIIELSLSAGFPDTPPTMFIHDNLSSKHWELDPDAYRYSPRWDADRMSEELFNHACKQIPLCL